MNLTTQKSALIESIHEANNRIHEARETLTVYMEENEKLKENVNRTKDIQDELKATKQALSSARQSAYYKRLKRKEAALEKNVEGSERKKVELKDKIQELRAEVKLKSFKRNVESIKST